MGSSAHFLLNIFCAGLHKLHSSLPVESKSDDEMVTVPENTELEMAPEGKVGTAYLILKKRAWRKRGVI